MEKLELIKCITGILKEYGSFSIGELDGEDQSVTVGTLGGIVGLAEYFTVDCCTVNVYDPSIWAWVDCKDPFDTYEEKYEALSEDVLSEVLFVCEQWEAECIRTQKRISN
jgi:hypothetical protein